MSREAINTWKKATRNAQLQHQLDQKEIDDIEQLQELARYTRDDSDHIARFKSLIEDMSQGHQLSAEDYSSFLSYCRHSANIWKSLVKVSNKEK